MNKLADKKIRNIGIIAHIDAGKTTLSERILFYTQKIHKMGEVHDGAATMDFMPEEQERGITINAACTTCDWHGFQLNLVDTPGHMDFTMEVERSLRVLDAAIGVFCAVGAVEPQSETVWRQADEFALPRLAFINKIDRKGADFQNVLDEMRLKLGAKTLPLTIPAGEGDEFSGVYDLLKQKKLVFEQEDEGRTVLELDPSPEEQKIIYKWREKALETIAENDDEFLTLWLGGDYSDDDIREAIRRVTKKSILVPVFCGSALKNAGVQPLLNGITDFLPSPNEVSPPAVILENGKTRILDQDKEKFPLALVFKVDLRGGRKSCYLRMYSGLLKAGDQIIDMRTGRPERVAHLYRMHADRREQIEQIGDGDIALITGFRSVQTGDTLASQNFPCLLEAIQESPTVISYSLEPKNADEAKILDEALARYVEEDPALNWQIEEESGLRILSGLGELHLEVTLERLEREYKIKPRKGQPQAALRETVLGTARFRANFDKIFGKERQAGEVEVQVEALPRNSGVKVVFECPEPEGQQESQKNRLLWQTAIRDGINPVLQSGPLAGWPVTDLEIKVLDASRPDGQTTIPGLEMAAGLAVREAMLGASPVLLEPVMKVEIVVPEEFLGPCLQLLQQNGGKVDKLEDMGKNKKVEAKAPMRQLFGFATRLRSSTQGRAGFNLAFDSYDISA